MNSFRSAIEARDPDAVAAVLADDVVFRSPIVFQPYAGRAAAVAVLSAAFEVLDDFAYESELASDDGRHHALTFHARVGDRQIEGCDFVHHDEHGLVDRLTVMVRPLSGTLALRGRMTAQLETHNARL